MRVDDTPHADTAQSLRPKLDHKLCTHDDPDNPAVTGDDTGRCDGVPVYRIERIAPMKTNTLAGERSREQARDLYDIAWLMQHHTEHIIKTQRLRLDRWAKAHGAEDEGRWKTLFDEDAVLRRAGYNDSMLALMACLEHDAALKMMRNPQAKLTMKPVDGRMAGRINGEEYDRVDTEAHAIAHLRRLGFNRGREEAHSSEGRKDALSHVTTTATIRKRLRTDSDYHQGWHDARPHALQEFGVPLLEDPTRPSGWIIANF